MFGLHRSTASFRGTDPRAGERGQVLIVAALMLTVLLGFVALTFDVGRLVSEHRYLQNAADAAVLAAGNDLGAGNTTDHATTTARALLVVDLATPPGGAATQPATTPVYAAGHAGDPKYLIDGIIVTASDIRIAISENVPLTFGNVVGVSSTTISASAHATMPVTGLLPVVAKAYWGAIPGPNISNPSPCTNNNFYYAFATADTACMGTTSSNAGRTDPTPGAAFNAGSPNNDPSHHGPIFTLVGQGADANISPGGNSFRGFVALDIRNFSSSNSQIYYNGLSSGLSVNATKNFEANWVQNGYPGPAFPNITSPPSPDLQVGVLDGTSSGIVVNPISTRYNVGDEVPVIVYSGIVQSIPDFTPIPPNTITLNNTGTLASAGTGSIQCNNAFSGQVTFSTLADTYDPTNIMNTGTLLGGTNPITYASNPTTPTTSGVSFSLSNISTSSAPTGVYPVWVQSQAGSPYLTTKLSVMYLNVGTVTHDFNATAAATSVTAANPGDTVTMDVTIKDTSNSGSYGSNVALSVDDTMGMTDTFSAATVTPTASGVTSTLTINTGAVAAGDYDIVIRATGINAFGHPVTRLLPLTVKVATTSSGGNYVDIIGYSVVRIVSSDSNSVTAYAIEPVVSSPGDARMERGTTPVLAAW
jgi:hypothetical protein